MKTRKLVSPGKTSRGKKWVMAIDPFAGLEMTPIYNFAKAAAEQWGAQLHPVYVLGPPSFNWTGEFSGPWFRRFAPLAKQAAEAKFPLTTVDVIHSKEPMQRAQVKTLLQHAKKLKAEMVIVASHSRHGLERLVLGSFAETLLNVSPLPVLVVPPQGELPKTLKRVLVPVDLGRGAKGFVSEIANFAKRSGAEIVLYHKMPDPLDPIVQQGVYTFGGGWVSVQSYLEEDMTSKTKQLLQLEAMVRKKGVSCRHVVDSSPQGLVESILKARQSEGCDVVAVMTQVGPWSASLLGSVARGIVRAHALALVI